MNKFVYWTTKGLEIIPYWVFILVMIILWSGPLSYFQKCHSIKESSGLLLLFVITFLIGYLGGKKEGARE